jgi:5-methylcytosine-specific restriction endonuclease McrA
MRDTSQYGSDYLMDGHAVAVDHWAGEINEPGAHDRATQAGNIVTKALRYLILERNNFKCQACGRGKDDGVTLEVDHVTPKALGGETSIENLQALCRDCNRGKGFYSADV